MTPPRSRKKALKRLLPFPAVKSCTIITAICLLTTILLATAQEPSPLKLSWPVETSLLVSGLAGQIIGQHRLAEMTPAGPNDLKKQDLAPWDKPFAGQYNAAASSASDVLVFAVGGAMVYADIWDKTRPQSSWTPLLQDGVILAEAFAWSSALNLNVRALRIHPRPFVYDSTNGSSASERAAPEAAGSFYSGHASEAFLGAAYFATVYPLRHPEFQHTGLLWGTSLTAATAVAVLRVASGKHFPSDVVAGAAIGTVLGWGFAKMHETSFGKDGGKFWSLQAWPQPGGFALQGARSFAAL